MLALHAPMPVTLRPARLDDHRFLLEVYASTRADEMALVSWTPDQQRAFVEMQFNAQRTHYQTYYPQAAYDIILRAGRRAGRLIVNRSDDEILVLDIALLPEHRGAGVGSALIRELQAESALVRKPLRLHVETFNPAQRLYERLQFRKVAEVGVYFLMEWNGHG